MNPSAIQPPFKFYQRLVNLSTVHLTREESDLLEYGPKYTVPPLSRPGTVENIVADIAPSVSHAPPDLVDQIVNTIHCSDTPTIQPLQRRALTSLREKITSEDLVVTKADKGSTIVLMDRTDYNNKMFECLHSIQAKADPLFNFSSYNNDFRTAINGCKHLIDKEPIRKAILVPNPSIPLAYGLPKLHKEGSPLRPVVSYLSSPSYRLAKYLDKWFKQNSCFDPHLSIKNSSELISTLALTPPPPAGKHINFF